MKRWAVVTTVYRFSGALLTHVFAKRQKRAVNEVLSVRLIYVPGIKQSASGKDKFLTAAFLNFSTLQAYPYSRRRGICLCWKEHNSVFQMPFQRQEVLCCVFQGLFFVCTHTS